MRNRSWRKKDYTVAYTEEAIHMMDERMILKVMWTCVSDYREIRKQSWMKKQKNW